MTTSTTTSAAVTASNATKNPRPANVTWVSPYITVSDIDKMANFYNKAFNFEINEMVAGEDSTTWHGEMRYKDQLIMLGKAGAYDGTSKSPIMSGVESPMNLYLYCENVDSFCKQAVLAGATVVVEPQDMFWGDRMCKLKDPEGYLWCFATYMGS